MHRELKQRRALMQRRELKQYWALTRRVRSALQPRALTDTASSAPH